MTRFIRYFVAIICLNACATKPYTISNKMYKSKAKDLSRIISSVPQEFILADSLKISPYWIGAIHFGLRKPNFVIIHHTAQDSCAQTLKTFTLDSSQVSAHYLICKDGTLHHLMNDYLRAWHSGVGKWGNLTDVNSSSIGIELDNNGGDPFAEAQINTLLGLLARLKKEYNIPPANFIGHSDVAPSRKIDPNVNFPWKRLADSGYGLWYGDTTNVIMPPVLDSRQALRIIGYDVSNLQSAIQAFRRHFIQVENAGQLTEQEMKVLYMVMQKYY